MDSCCVGTMIAFRNWKSPYLCGLFALTLPRSAVFLGTVIAGCATGFHRLGRVEAEAEFLTTLALLSDLLSSALVAFFGG